MEFVNGRCQMNINKENIMNIKTKFYYTKKETKDMKQVMGKIKDNMI